MHTSLKLHGREKPFVCSHLKFREGKNGYSVCVVVNENIVLFHHHVYEDRDEANRIAFLIDDIGQIDLANWLWVHDPLSEVDFIRNKPTAKQVWKEARQIAT